MVLSAMSNLQSRPIMSPSIKSLSHTFSCLSFAIFLFGCQKPEEPTESDEDLAAEMEQDEALDTGDATVTEADELAEDAKEKIDVIGDDISDAVDNIRDRAIDLTDEIVDEAEDLGEEAKEAGQDAKKEIEDFLQKSATPDPE